MKMMKQGKSEVAVVILNWNGERFLDEYLPSVVANTPSGIADVIVADNGSTDGSLKLLADKFPTVKVVAFDKNYGFAEGYNKAIAETRYRYTVLLNSDVIVREDWLTPLYDFMVAHSEAGAVQPKIRSLQEPELFEYAGAAGGYLDRNGYPYCRGRIFSTVEKDSGQYDEPVQVFWATGAALMVDTELYLDLGGLDKEFFAHMEEIDFCWRVHLAGRQVWAVPSSTVYHLGGGSLPASNPRKTYLNFRNSLVMLYKNLPTATRGRRLTVRRLLDTVAWAKFVATFDFGNAAAIVRAHRDFRRMKKLYAGMKSPDVDLLSTFDGCHRNILTEYYLKGHKIFSALG